MAPTAGDAISMACPSRVLEGAEGERQRGGFLAVADESPRPARRGRRRGLLLCLRVDADEPVAAGNRQPVPEAAGAIDPVGRAGDAHGEAVRRCRTVRRGGSRRGSPGRRRAGAGNTADARTAAQMIGRDRISGLLGAQINAADASVRATAIRQVGDRERASATFRALLACLPVLHRPIL